jgi:hypothetical protein
MRAAALCCLTLLMLAAAVAAFPLENRLKTTLRDIESHKKSGGDEDKKKKHHHEPDHHKKHVASGGGRCDRVANWAIANDGGYGGLCLEMCKMAWASVGVNGIDYLDQASAHDAVGVAQRHAGWHRWSGANPPRGAVVLFSECGNQPYGHACISNVDGCINNGGAGIINWAEMEAHWCAHQPAGWILPASC